MRYLIVGGTSIFGEGLIDRLLRKPDTEVIVATRQKNERSFYREHLIWHELDVQSAEETDSVVQLAAPDLTFDFATQDSVGKAWDDPVTTVNINIVGTINLLNAIKTRCPHTRIVIGGSGEEYGTLSFSDLPINESLTPNPNNIYGATKACQTMFAKLYNQAFNMDVVVVRTFYETSVRQDETFAISSFCKQFAEIELGIRAPVLYTGNINNIRDFTDVDDLIRAFEIVAERGRSGEIYNAARGECTALLDIIRILENITGINVEIRMTADRIRPMDAPALVADVNKIYEECGWKAEIPIKVTVERMLNKWRGLLSDNN